MVLAVGTVASAAAVVIRDCGWRAQNFQNLRMADVPSAWISYILGITSPYLPSNIPNALNTELRRSALEIRRRNRLASSCVV